MKTLISTLFLTLVLSLGTATNLFSQETAIAAGEEQKKEQQENEKKAFVLLDQVVNEAQMLRLAENRIRVQIGAADLLWAKDEGRARSLFSLAAEGVTEMMRTSENTEQQQRRGPNQGRTGAQLRQELLLTVASHDAPLAYQLLAATRPLNPPATETNNSRRFDSEQNLEEALLAQVAALDPEFALRNAEQLLDKGEYSRSLTEVLKHLQSKDKDAAAKLEERIVKKLRSENMVANNDASGLALNLLQPGPRLTDDNSAIPPSGRQPVLGTSNYQDLMTVLIEAALRTTPPSATNQPRQATRGRGGRNAGRPNTPPPPQNQLTDAQNEQQNARRLLGGFRSLLPLVDQYVPGRAAALRQKFSEIGMAENNRRQQQVGAPVYLPTTDSLLSAASLAPPAAQSRMYQMAALKALEEGNPDRARQIANDHLDERRKQSVLQQIEFRQLSAKTEASRIDEVRNTLASLPSDFARVDMLVQLADSVRKKNPELAIELLDQAREFTNKRATGYEQFEMQLRVAAGFRDLPSTHGFEVLEPGVMQLNELLSAAAVLSGFEVNVFREGEMPLQGGSRLGDIVRRYGQEIGRLGKADYQRAEMLASRFQFAEPRIVARLALVRSLLGIEAAPGRNNPRRTGFFSLDGVRE